MEMEDEVRYFIWLSQAFSYGNSKLIEILSSFVSLKEFYKKVTEETEEFSFLTKKEIIALQKTSMERVDKIIEDCKTMDIKIVTAKDKKFPKNLLNIYAPPIVLYYKGNIKNLGKQLTIGMVGTRNINDYSRKVTYHIARELSQSNVLIVSGGAVGVDETSHEGSLSVNGRTFVIMGCGVDVNYPSQNSKQREEVLEKGGALISELPPKTQVNSRYFPVRNRIIAGLSHGVCVTHAPIRSGALITAEHAIEQGKELFCVPPWNIFDNRCMGVMKYIQSGCVVVASGIDILSEYPLHFSLNEEIDIEDDFNQIRKREMMKLNLGLKSKSSKKENTAQELQPKVKKEAPKDIQSNQEIQSNQDVQSNQDIQSNQIEETKESFEDIKVKNKEYYDNLNENQKAVFDSLSIEPKLIEEIFFETGIGVTMVLSILTDFEIDGIITPHSGRRYSFK